METDAAPGLAIPWRKEDVGGFLHPPFGAIVSRCDAPAAVDHVALLRPPEQRKRHD